MTQTPLIFKNCFEELNRILEEKKPSTIFILTDENTHIHCLPILLTSLDATDNIEIIEIPAGEENKTPETAVQIWGAMADTGGDRKSLLINLGGGMITDIGGFIASTFMRGIDFVNIPTSLLGMVDASIGGKTGLDVEGVKNLIGTFNFPVCTLIYPEFLHTLPERELRAGIAEMLKHGLIYDKKHWEKLISLNEISVKNLKELIRESIEIKSQIVAEDFRESGKRKILNFGHTIGHALESEYLQTETPLLHGEAIAAGMMIEAVLSYENEMISTDELNEILENLTRIYGKQPIPEERFESLLEWMFYDKKNDAGKANFSLLNGIGDCKFNIHLNREQILEGIRIYNHKMG